MREEEWIRDGYTCLGLTVPPAQLRAFQGEALRAWHAAGGAPLTASRRTADSVRRLLAVATAAALETTVHATKLSPHR